MRRETETEEETSKHSALFGMNSGADLCLHCACQTRSNARAKLVTPALRVLLPCSTSACSGIKGWLSLHCTRRTHWNVKAKRRTSAFHVLTRSMRAVETKAAMFRTTHNRFNQSSPFCRLLCALVSCSPSVSRRIVLFPARSAHCVALSNRL